MSDMGDEYDAEALRAFVALLRGIRQDRAIARAELALLDTPEHAKFPMPNQAHPSLAGSADFVRHLRQSGAIRLPRFHRVNYATLDEAPGPNDAMLDTVTLTARKVWAPAPFVARFVGDEAAYVWRAWGDGSSRYITTDAELVQRW
jgi:hypothetical protein